MKRFWVSWVQTTQDFRPLSDPPNIRILGWWCSGIVSPKYNLCAVVEAESVDAAHEAVLIDWPESDEWRFIEEKPKDWLPGDRFPLSDWMVERFTGVTVKSVAKDRGKDVDAAVEMVTVEKAILEKVWQDLFAGLRPVIEVSDHDEIEDVLRRMNKAKSRALDNGIAGLRDILFNGRARVSDPVKVDYV